MDAADLLLALEVSPLAAYAIRRAGLQDTVREARERYCRLTELRAGIRAAFEGGEIARAEELRAEARRLRDELEGR